jgi:excisionase family DNA binding protein
MTLKETYSTGEVAELLGVHIDTVRRFCDNGELEFEKGLLSTHRRIRPSSLEKFMLSRGISENIIKECGVKQIPVVERKRDSSRTFVDYLMF